MKLNTWSLLNGIKRNWSPIMDEIPTHTFDLVPGWRWIKYSQVCCMGHPDIHNGKHGEPSWSFTIKYFLLQMRSYPTEFIQQWFYQSLHLHEMSQGNVLDTQRVSTFFVEVYDNSENFLFPTQTWRLICTWYFVQLWKQLPICHMQLLEWFPNEIISAFND